MDRQEWKEKTGIRTLGSTIYAKGRGNWLQGKIISFKKDAGQVSFPEQEVDGGKIQAFSGDIPYDKILPFTMISYEQIVKEKEEEKVKQEQARKQVIVKRLNSYIETYNNSIAKFKVEFEKDPIMALKWYADDVFIAHKCFLEVSAALDEAQKRSVEQGLPIEEVIVEVSDLFWKYLVKEQLRYDGSRSTSKMENLHQEDMALARSKLLRDFQYLLEKHDLF